MSVERNFGPSGSAQLNPELTARLYGQLSQEQPVQIEYQQPMGAQFPAENLQAAKAFEEIQGEGAKQRLLAAQTRVQEGVAAVNPQKTKLAAALIESYTRFGAQQATIAAQRARAQQDPAWAMAQLGVATLEDLWAWFDQQQEELRRQQQATARALKTLVPDIDLTAFEGGGEGNPIPAGGGPGGGPAGGLSPAGQAFMNRFKR